MSGEGICPKCGKEQYAYGETDYSPSSHLNEAILQYVPVSCECGFEGYEIWELCFNRVTDKEGNDV